MPAILHDDPTLFRFEMEDDGVLAVANYRLADNLITFTHTEVPRQARGHGVASRLIAGALETARTRGAQGRRALLFCARFPRQAPRISRALAITLYTVFPMQVDLSESRALVTGSKGIGRAIAQEPAANGPEVVINGPQSGGCPRGDCELARENLPKGRFKAAPGDVGTAAGAASIIEAAGWF
jgi:predicted GNAT family acetyltransferase